MVFGDYGDFSDFSCLGDLCGPSDFGDLGSFAASYGTGGLVVSEILLVLINLFLLVILVVF